MYEILAFGNDEDCQNSRTNDNWSHVRKQQVSAADVTTSWMLLGYFVSDVSETPVHEKVVQEDTRSGQPTCTYKKKIS